MLVGTVVFLFSNHCVIFSLSNLEESCECALLIGHKAQLTNQSSLEIQSALGQHTFVVITQNPHQQVLFL